MNNKSFDLHPDLKDLLETLRSAPEDVTHNIDMIANESFEVDIARLNYDVARIQDELEATRETRNELVRSHQTLHKGLRTLRWTVDMICFSVLALAGIKLAEVLQWM